MNEIVSPIIQIVELIELIKTTSVVLIDATNSPNARKKYLDCHLKGALFIDANSQLSSPKENPANGGRHPLPSLAEFCETIGKLGVSPESHVVVYDSNAGANAAARFWWMLRAIGHEKVQVLNGGLQEALRLNFPTNVGEESRPTQVKNTVKKWILPTIDIEDVERALLSNTHKVVDVREEGRYNGEYEPIDAIAGHIPGAINIPFKLNLDENGLFRSPDQLKEFYSEQLDPSSADQCIVHCGSGVTACHTILAMMYAGFPFPKLYVGSWSEWSRSGKEIA